MGGSHALCCATDPRENGVSRGSVELRLRLLQAFGVQRLDCVRRARDDRVRVLVRIEVRQDVVGERARIAALRPADADAQSQKVLRLQVLGDRA